MDLLKYLEPMKNLPKRFSNLAFWRDVRKFKDDVVNALEYVDSWGENVETTIKSLGVKNYFRNSQFKFNETSISVPSGTFGIIEVSGFNSLLYIDHIYNVKFPSKIPTTFRGFISTSITVTQNKTSVTCLGIAIPMTVDGVPTLTINSAIGKIPSGTIDTSVPLIVTDAFIYYTPSI